MKKKILSAILLVCMALGLVACGSNSGEVNNEKDKGNSLIGGLLNTEKDKVPVKVEDALASDKFEFIYNLNEVPDSYWTDENTAKVKEYLSDNVYSLDYKLMPGVVDFEIDCVAGDKKSRHSDVYTLSLKGNNMLFYTKLNKLDYDTKYTYFHLLGNDFDTYTCLIELEEYSKPGCYDFVVEPKLEEWVYTYRDTSDSASTMYCYAYKISENCAIVINLPTYHDGTDWHEKSPYTEEQIKELGDYILSLVDVKKVEKEKLGVRLLTDSISLGNGITFNMKNTNFIEIGFDGKTDFGNYPYFIMHFNDEDNANGKRFIELQSEEDFNNWMVDDVDYLVDYNEHIKIVKTNSSYQSKDSYTGIVMQADGKYYVLFTYFDDHGKLTDETFVNKILEDTFSFESK